MKGLLKVSSVMLLFLASTAISFQTQQGGIKGCYQKNNGQLRIVQNEDDCTLSELAVSWPHSASNIGRKGGSRRITALQTLGGTDNFAYATNDRGEVVGSSGIAGAGSHAFLYRQGQITDISPLNSGDFQTVGPTGINNHGKVVSGLVDGGVYVPAIYDSLAQTITTLGFLGGSSFGFAGVATSINNNDEAVGFAHLNAITRHAFLFRNGVMTDIGSFGGDSAATDINDAGAIVGFATNLSQGTAHAFLYSDGALKDIDPFGVSVFGVAESYARAINNRGDVVGEGLLQNGSAFHAFLRRRGVVTDLGVLPGGRNSFGKSINEPGQVVGTADIPYEVPCEPGQTPPCINFKLVAFLYTNGVMIDLNSLIPPDSGWELISAFDVNNRGQIVGYGLLNGHLRAFLLN